MSIKISGAALLALAFTTPAAANLLVNGGFEATPTVPLNYGGFAPGGHVQNYPAPAVNVQYLPGWAIQKPFESDLYRAPVTYPFVPAAADEGLQFFSLNWSPAGGITLDNRVSQVFTLGAGATGIDFSIAMAVESGFAGSTLQVSVLSGATIVAQSGLFSHALGNGTWSQHGWSTTLGAGTYTLELHGIGAGNAWDILVDDAVLTQVGGGAGAVPEPAAWTLLVAGFGLTGAAMRRRQAFRAVAA